MSKKIKLNTETPKKRKTHFILLTLSAFAIIMFFFSYALVPLYNVMCKSLGINGKTSNVKAVATNNIDYSRTVTIQFIATNNAELPWDFFPNIKSVEIHPGENIKLSFHARNNTNQTMTVQAIPSVTPGLAAGHLKKTECFCFTQQTLNGREAKDMPVIFHIDETLPENINTITLSYTLFEAIKSIKNKVPGRLN